MEVNLLHNSSRPVVFVIDASSANKVKKSGVEMYAFQLIQNMKKHALEENERVILYSPTKLEGALGELPPGWESRVLSWALPFGWMKCRVGWELFRQKPDVVFVPSQGLPYGKTNMVTTIHDVGFRRLPNVYDAQNRKRLERVTKRSVKKASHLMTVSAFSKSEIESFYHTAPDRISVTHLAADTSVYRRLSLEEIDLVLQRNRIGKHFFLYVGRLDQKKNIETIIRAFDQFKMDRGVGDPYELVLVGEQGFGFASMKNWIDRSAAREQIRVLGYLEDADVAALMNAATAFLFPSWYEGFGIPNVEAMNCGTPLLVSDIPVHHEVIGDAALFVSPEDPKEWVRAMKQLAENNTLQEQLRQKGSLRSVQFDWKKTAEETWKVLQSLV